MNWTLKFELNTLILDQNWISCTCKFFIRHLITPFLWDHTRNAKMWNIKTDTNYEANKSMTYGKGWVTETVATINTPLSSFGERSSLRQNITSTWLSEAFVRERERERERERWEGALVLQRRGWTVVLGQPVKTKFLQNTSESMVKENGETLPKEQVFL